MNLMLLARVSQERMEEDDRGWKRMEEDGLEDEDRLEDGRGNAACGALPGKEAEHLGRRGKMVSLWLASAPKMARF